MALGIGVSPPADHSLHRSLLLTCSAHVCYLPAPYSHVRVGPLKYRERVCAGGHGLRTKKETIYGIELSQMYKLNTFLTEH